MSRFNDCMHKKSGHFTWQIQVLSLGYIVVYKVCWISLTNRVGFWCINKFPKSTKKYIHCHNSELFNYYHIITYVLCFIPGITFWRPTVLFELLFIITCNVYCSNINTLMVVFHVCIHHLPETKEKETLIRKCKLLNANINKSLHNKIFMHTKVIN